MDIENNTEILLEAAKNGNLTEVNRLIPISDSKRHYSAALRAAISNDHMDCVKALIGVSGDYNFVFSMVALDNQLEYVKMLMPLSDNHEDGLHAATANNHIECVKLLLPGCKGIGPALCLAIQNYHNECAQVLLSDCLTKDTTYMKEWALHTAVEFGNTEAVKMLLPYVDPSIKDSQALALAVYGENQECFDLLYPLSNVAQAFKVVQQRFGHKVGLFQIFQDTIESTRQQDVLINAVDGDNHPVKPKQKM